MTDTSDTDDLDDEFRNDPYSDYLFGADLLEGIHYDYQYGDIVSLDIDHSADELIIESPAGEELERVDATAVDPGDYSRVPERAVEHPAGWYIDLVNSLLEHAYLTPDENAGLRYAEERVRITVEDDHEE